MTIIKSFALPFHPEERISFKGSGQKNRISVFLGVNGTQKSSILRGLLEDALFNSFDVEAASQSPVKRKNLTCTTQWKSAPPAKVVAISSAATDRFPSKASFGETRFLTRYDVAKYAYAGPRTGRNIVSRTQSVQSLLSEFFRAESTHDSVSNLIDHLSEKTTVPCRLRMRLSSRPRNPGPERSSSLPSSFHSFLETGGKSFPSMWAPKLKNYIESAQSDSELMMNSERLYYEVRKNKFLWGNIDLRYFDRFVETNIELHAIHFGLTLGFIGLDEVEFMLPSDERVSPDAFSAGQWGLFSSLATAALAVRDQTLLLIDEPENALHPAWQRDYIANLQLAISHRHGCHAVLATHSPLIVSGLSSSAADLIGLRLNSDLGVSMKLLDVPMGWQATDVLEGVFDLPSTRSPAIVEEIESAMSLIAEGVDKNAAKLKLVAKRLLPLIDSLPEEDVARQVISSICRVSGVIE